MTRFCILREGGHWRLALRGRRRQAEAGRSCLVPAVSYDHARALPSRQVCHGPRSCGGMISTVSRDLIIDLLRPHHRATKAGRSRWLSFLWNAPFRHDPVAGFAKMATTSRLACNVGESLRLFGIFHPTQRMIHSSSAAWISQGFVVDFLACCVSKDAHQTDFPTEIPGLIESEARRSRASRFQPMPKEWRCGRVVMR